jgi:long-subunit acyl-CoA synthetase (AMP-forming)
MSPANIQNAVLDACPLLGHVMAIGDRRPYVTALLVLDPDAATAFAAAHGIAADSPAQQAAHPLVRAEVQRGVDAANARLSKVEAVRGFTIVPEYWMPGSDVLTPTMKIRRAPIAERYAAAIDAMYVG